MGVFDLGVVAAGDVLPLPPHCPGKDNIMYGDHPRGMSSLLVLQGYKACEVQLRQRWRVPVQNQTESISSRLQSQPWTLVHRGVVSWLHLYPLLGTDRARGALGPG